MCRYAKSVKIFFILLFVVVHLSVASERRLIDKKKKLEKDHRIYQPFVGRNLQPLKVQQAKKLQTKFKSPLKEEQEEFKEEKKLEEKQRLEAKEKVEEQLQRMEENILEAQKVADMRKQHEQQVQQQLLEQLKQREHKKSEEQKRIEDLRKVEERWKLQEQQQLKELQNIEKILQRQDQEKEERMQKQLQHELQKKELEQRGRQEEKPAKYDKKQQQQETVKQKQQEIKVQLESLNGHLYDYFKKRLQVVENELSYHKLNDFRKEQKRYPQIWDKSADATAPNKRSDLSLAEDNFYKNYKNRIDVIDKELAIGNRKLMSDRLARSFFDWFKNFLHNIKERKASK